MASSGRIVKGFTVDFSPMGLPSIRRPSNLTMHSDDGVGCGPDAGPEVSTRYWSPLYIGERRTEDGRAGVSMVGEAKGVAWHGVAWRGVARRGRAAALVMACG